MHFDNVVKRVIMQNLHNAFEWQQYVLYDSIFYCVDTYIYKNSYCYNIVCMMFWCLLSFGSYTYFISHMRNLRLVLCLCSFTCSRGEVMSPTATLLLHRTGAISTQEELFRCISSSFPGHVHMGKSSGRSSQQVFPFQSYGVNSVGSFLKLQSKIPAILDWIEFIFFISMYIQ